MITFPSEPTAPTAAGVADRLRTLAGLAARRSVTLTLGDIELLIAAAQLITLAYGLREPVAGEGAA